MCGTSLCTYRLMQPESSTPAQVSVYWSVHHRFKSKFNSISFRGRYCEPARVCLDSDPDQQNRPWQSSHTVWHQQLQVQPAFTIHTRTHVVLLDSLHSVLQKAGFVWVSSRAAAPWDWTENSGVQLTANMKMLTYSEPQTPVSVVLFCLEPQCTAARKPPKGSNSPGVEMITELRWCLFTVSAESPPLQWGHSSADSHVSLLKPLFLLCSTGHAPLHLWCCSRPPDQVTWPGHLISVSHTCQTSVSRCVKDEHTCSLTLTGFHMKHLIYMNAADASSCSHAPIQTTPPCRHGPVNHAPI